mgnify:FL=1
MEETLRATLEETLADPASGPNAITFLVIAGLGLAMALIYVPVRLFLTITARSRRLRLLQRIRRLRDVLGQPLGGSSSESMASQSAPGDPTTSPQSLS